MYVPKIFIAEVCAHQLAPQQAVNVINDGARYMACTIDAQFGENAAPAIQIDHQDLLIFVRDLRCPGTSEKRLDISNPEGPRVELGR